MFSTPLSGQWAFSGGGATMAIQHQVGAEHAQAHTLNSQGQVGSLTCFEFCIHADEIRLWWANFPFQFITCFFKKCKRNRYQYRYFLFETLNKRNCFYFLERLRFPFCLFFLEKYWYSIPVPSKRLTWDTFLRKTKIKTRQRYLFMIFLA